MGSTKINNLVKKIYTKIKARPCLPKSNTSNQSGYEQISNIAEKTSPISTSNILQQLEQIQSNEDELSFT